MAAEGSIQAGAFPIDVVSTSTALAKEVDHYGTGRDRVYLFNASPVEYTTPDPLGAPNAQQSEVLTDITYKCRNKYSSNMPIGEKLVIVLGADGIGSVVSWEC